MAPSTASPFDNETFWYRHIKHDIALRNYGRMMYGRSKSAESKEIIFYGICYLENSIATGINALGGLLGEW